MPEVTAFWTERAGAGVLRTEALPPLAAGDVLVRTLYTGVSRGTETTVFGGHVPESEHARMRAPFQEGDFPGPVKYGYLSVGVVEAGEADLADMIGRTVFCLYPHQTAYVVAASEVDLVPDGVPARRAVLAGPVPLTVVPDDPSKPYDMREVIRRIVDDEEFFEVHEHFAKNIICGFSRLDGHPVGVVGNQPAFLAGVLDIEASEKAARFVRTCDCYNVPLLTFTDVPGFLPGTDQEWNGIIRHGAKLLYAYTEATVPKLTVVTRKAYGGAYDVMASKHMLADFNYAWPTAEVAVMGPEGAVNIIYRKDIANSPTPDERRQKLIDDYKAHFANPYSAAERGYIDDVIEPRQTRPKLIKALRMLQSKRVPQPKRKHGNIPL